MAHHFLLKHEWVAIKILARSGTPEVQDMVAHALTLPPKSDEWSEVRRANEFALVAVDFLSLREDSRAIPHILRLLRGGSDRENSLKYDLDELVACLARFDVAQGTEELATLWFLPPSIEDEWIFDNARVEAGRLLLRDKRWEAAQDEIAAALAASDDWKTIRALFLLSYRSSRPRLKSSLRTTLNELLDHANPRIRAGALATHATLDSNRYRVAEELFAGENEAAHRTVSQWVVELQGTSNGTDSHWSNVHELMLNHADPTVRACALVMQETFVLSQYSVAEQLLAGENAEAQQRVCQWLAELPVTDAEATARLHRLYSLIPQSPRFADARRKLEQKLRRSVPPVLGNVIPRGAVWRYLDDGTDQGTAWRQPEFEDDSWNSGASELGYGDGNETTLVEYGNDEKNKHVTTYFRHSFKIPHAHNITSLVCELIVDDGAIVYLNGRVAFRHNLSQDPTFMDFAEARIDGLDEQVRHLYLIDRTLLNDGHNILAVEVHQFARDSSDISFELTLTTNGVEKLTDAIADPLRRDAAEMLAQLGHGAEDAIPKLEDLLQSELATVRVAAASAIVRIAPDLSKVVIPDPRSAAERKLREDVATLLNNRIWEIVALRGQTADAYSRARRDARVVQTFAPNNGLYLNTVGIAQYRHGEWDAAIDTLTEAHHLERHPSNLLFLAMAQDKLGLSTEAREHYRHALDMMQLDQWRQNDECVAFLREAENVFDGNLKAHSGP